ncbi:AMP-binding protein [Saccharopolyspora dendranthemae]|nr:AMP-binding protein [Saccharopolyspora dendranthemae]
MGGRMVLDGARPRADQQRRRARDAYSWFARSAQRCPGHIALESAEQRVTYAELRERAERLSAVLVELRPRRVGLLAGPSPEACAGLLAVLRAGATAVPLDPEEPASHVRAILRATRLDALITDRENADTGFGVPEYLAGVDGADPASVPPAPPLPGSDACILFSRVSAERLRGVPVSHRDLADSLDQAVDDGERVPVGLDRATAITAMFRTWARGGTLVVQHPVAPART